MNNKRVHGSGVFSNGDTEDRSVLGKRYNDVVVCVPNCDMCPHALV